MFVDQAKIFVKGGDGGNGIISWRREKFVPFGGPAGGDGGSGGDVVLVVEEGLRTLIDFRYQRHFKAERGEYGRPKNKYGKSAPDLVVKVPPGTVVRDFETGALIADLVRHGQQAIVAKGGRGGHGNTHFMSGINKAPEIAENGEPGDERWITLELKVLADVGLVGFPSVGKSTLLSAVSSARPKVAEYHFTTLTPQLGVVETGDGRSFVLADLPGLIEGAHMGQGLGHEFLRHIERTRVVVHVIDMAAVEGRDPIEDYQTISAELVAHDLRLEERPTLIAANKMDLEGAAEHLESFRNAYPNLPVFPISGVTKHGVAQLLYAVADLLDSLPSQASAAVPDEHGSDELTGAERDEQGNAIAPAASAEGEEKIYKYEAPQPFVIRREGAAFVVDSADLERMVKMTNFTQYDAVKRFQRILRAKGVDKALRAKGARDGDTVQIGDMEFDFEDGD